MDLTSEFNYAADGPTGEAEALEGSPSPQNPNTSGAQNIPSQAEEFTATAGATEKVIHDAPAPRPEPLTVENAEAELETLEGGRAAPAPRNNLNPSTRTKKIIDSTFERQREGRVCALKAYLEFRQNEPASEVEHEAGEELEFDLQTLWVSETFGCAPRRPATAVWQGAPAF